MARPNNSINKITSPTNTYEIIPHRLTDGTNLASLPILSQDVYLTVSSDQIVIPAAPSTAGEYLLVFSKNNGVVTPSWTTIDNAVHYVTSHSDTSLGDLVYYQSGTAAGSLSIVYYSE